MPRVSVIVPNYNHGKFLHSRLESIFSQTFQDFEVILLDDCSADDSISILSQYKEHPSVSHFIINDKNSGSPFKQWEKGIQLARGEFIWLAESDDYSDVYFLEKLIPMLKNNSTISISFCGSLVVDEIGMAIRDGMSRNRKLDATIWNNPFVMDGLQFIDRFLIMKNVIPNASSVVFRKSRYEEVSKDYKSFKYLGDWMLWVRLLEKGAVAFIPSKLNYFRFHPQVTRIYNTLNRVKENALERYYIIEAIEQLGIPKSRKAVALRKSAHRTISFLGLKLFTTSQGRQLREEIIKHDPAFDRYFFQYYWIRIKRKLKLVLNVNKFS